MLFSCLGEYRSENDDRLEIDFKKYLIDMSKVKGKGSIMIQSNEFESTQNNPVNLDISENPGKKGALKLFDENNKIININNYNNDLNLKKNLFGTKLQYDLETIKSYIYIPNIIKLDYKDNILKAGSTIYWNVDNNNEKGVVIFLTYSPFDQISLELMVDNKNFISDGLAVKDSGSYTFTEADIERMPTGANVSLNVLRGNYFVNEIEKPSLVAFSTVSKNVSIYR